MKILHIADCHLDSAMESHLPARMAKSRRRELLLTFSGIMEAAEREGVSLVLIAGDLFDTQTPSAATLRYVFDCITAHSAMTFICIEGNHDRGALSESELPSNLFLVRAKEGKSFSFEGLTVHAAGFGASRTVLETFPFESGTKNILLLHGTLSPSQTDDREEIIPHALLEGKRIDYLALGHFHSYTAMSLAGGGLACYAGTPEGRGFDETGKCGVILLNSETMQAEFLITAQRTLHDIRVDVTDAVTQSEIEARVKDAIASISENDMVRLTLFGEVDDIHLKQPEQIKLLLDSRFYFAKVKDSIRLRLRADRYRNDISLRGEFVRRVMANEALSEADKQRVLAFGLRALDGEMPEDTPY